MDRSEVTSLLDSVSQALSAPFEIWLVVTYVLCMFLVTAFRPQQIGSVGLYRFSYILFTMYLIIPTVLRSILAVVNANRRDLGRNVDPTYAEQVMIPIFTGFSKVLFAFAILCGLAALRHYQRRDLPLVPDDDRLS